MKIYSAIYEDYAHIEKLYPQATPETIKHPDELNEHGILIIHGGSDISPTIYNQKPIKQTLASDKLSPRDQIELQLMKRAIEKGITIYGICRGAQLACCLAGGSLIQHVTGHQVEHTIYTDKDKLIANSAHHQMMNLTNTESELLAWSQTISSTYKTDKGEISVGCEPDIVWFPKIKALAIQGHPEWLVPANKYVRLCNTFLQKYHV